MSKTLLPPNATPTELLLEEAIDFSPQITADIPALRQIRTRQPAALAPWLLSEWTIADFRPYFTGDADCFNTMLPWLKLRGTAAAVKLALGAIGQASASLSVDEFHLSIHLPGPFTGRIADLRRAVDRSIPLHLDFYRMTSGGVVDRGHYDNSDYDGCAYDDDSGFMVDGLKLSYSVAHNDNLAPVTVQAKLSGDELCGLDRSLGWGDIAWGEQSWGHRVLMKQTQEVRS